MRTDSSTCAPKSALQTLDQLLNGAILNASNDTEMARLWAVKMSVKRALADLPESAIEAAARRLLVTLRIGDREHVVAA